jgi:hypothetical protein
MYEDILNPAVITARVKAGAEWLDEQEPGWAERIDTSQLNMSDPCGCIAGQLAGDYWRFVREWHSLSVGEQAKFGFGSLVGVNTGPSRHQFEKDACSREYDLLGHAFIAEITARRAKQATQPKGGA